jgi:hypothetical protein
VVQKVHERLLQPAKVVAVGVHVVGVDVGDDRHHRQQVQERGVGLVGLDHDVFARPQPGVGPGAVEPPADDEGRVQFGGGQHAGDQAGGGGLAVGAGNRDAFFHAHQLGQHDGARHHRQQLGVGGHHLGVVGLDRGGGDDAVGPVDVRGVVPDVDARAQLLQAAGGGAVAQVAARNGVALVEQHLGNAAHAGTTDADEMDVTDGVFHAQQARAGLQRSARPWA